MSLALVDSGPLLAVADSGERTHRQCLELLSRADLLPVLPAMVLSEVSYFVERRLGPLAEARFLDGVAALRIEAPTPADLQRMAELVEQYADFPLGGADASVIALAERLGVTKIITLDRRHFGAVKPRHADSFELLP